MVSNSMLRAGAVLLMGASLCAAQVMRNQPLPMPEGTALPADPKAAVRFLDPQQVTVPARKSTEIVLHFKVADGLHINSHKPREESLIPARLAIVEEPGLNVTAVEFPPGTDYALQLAPQEKLSVYTGDFVLHAHVTAQPGGHLLNGGLRYQACDSNACMPPHTIPVAISVIAQ